MAITNTAPIRLLQLTLLLVLKSLRKKTSELKAEGTFSHPGVTGKNQDAQLGQLGTSHIDSKGLMSQLCVDYRGRNPNLGLKKQKLSNETQG